MKQKSTFLKVFMTLMLLCGVSSMWAQATWTLVTSVDELKAGGTFVLGYKGSSDVSIIPLRSADCDATTTANGYFYTGTTSSSSTNGQININKATDLSDYEIVISASTNTSGAVNIKINGGFIGATSGGGTSNKGRLYTAGNSNETDLIPSYSKTDGFSFEVNVSGAYKYLKYNTGSPRFAFYNSKGDGIVIYKKGSASSVASPTFSVAAGTYADAQNVELSCTTEGATIYYTTDGKEPTASSTEYSGAITVSKSTTIKAIAIKGEEKSNIASASYKITTYASLADLVADGEPTKTGYSVTVTLTDEVIKSFYNTSYGNRNGIYLNYTNPEDEYIEIYCQNVPETWLAGGTVSGILIDCTWKNYNGTWELCPENWNALTYTAPTTYAINIDGAIANGTVEASATEAAAGVEVSLTVTPADHYELVSLNVIDASSNPITVTNNKFTMPASDVTVSATFKELPQYTVTVSDGDESWTKYAGETIELISRTSTNPDYTFVGWSETNVDDETTDVPTLVANPYTVGKNVCLYPVYKRTVVGEPENQTASVTIKDYAAEKKWANGEKYLEVSLDDNISINAISKGTTGQFNSGDNTWRMYQSSANLSIWTVDAANGAELKSVKFDYTNNNDGVLSYNGDTYDSGDEIKLSGSQSDNYTVGNTGSATNGQVRISAIEVKYVISATTNYFVSAIPNQTEMITISSVGYSTYSSTYALEVPETSVAEVFGAKVNDAGTAVTLIPVEEGTIIEAGEGFIVKGTANATVEFTVSSEAGEAISGNELLGTGATSKTLTANEAYLLGAKDGKAVFALCNAGTLGANKACLPATTGANGTLGFDDATGIEFELQDAKSNVVRYNLNGQVVGNDYKGIIIVNGKKFLNK